MASILPLDTGASYFNWLPSVSTWDRRTVIIVLGVDLALLACSRIFRCYQNCANSSPESSPENSPRELVIIQSNNASRTFAGFRSRPL